MKPFRKSAQAETSTIILEKGRRTKYPVPYFVWTPNKKICEDDNLSAIKKKTVIEQKDAYPSNPKDPKSTWIIQDQAVIPPKIYTNSNYYIPRHGIVNDLNAVFFVNILGRDKNLLRIKNNATKTAKKKVKPIETCIEKDLVFPFLKPKNVRKWMIDGYLYGLVPQKKDGESNESELRVKYPKTYRYLSKFKPSLLKRSSRWFKAKGRPFYSIFGIGNYSFYPFKVVWSCMGFLPYFAVVSKINDRFIGNKLVLPDNTIGSISVKDEKEAHFICAILNSKTVNEQLRLLSSGSKWGISINTVKKIGIPKFDDTDTTHITLAELSAKAHQKNGITVKKIEAKIDRLSKKIIKP